MKPAQKQKYNIKQHRYRRKKGHKQATTKTDIPELEN
jgi:ribosomal protein L21